MLRASGGYSLLGEYVTLSVRSSSVGDPRFSGYYLTGNSKTTLSRTQ
jgi:hypothetical protein